MRVALIHYWLVGMRGGERVLEELCRLYPDAVIYTHAVDRDALSPTLLKHEIRTTFISRLPNPTRLYKRYLPLMPLALEQLDLNEFDLVISSESGPAKGVIVHPDALHVCYCHSPMRYIWDMYPMYRRTAGTLTRLLMPPLAHYLRMWDTASAARVDRFVANSAFISRRIRHAYGRDADVVHPPVNVDAFGRTGDAPGEHYLFVGELTAYKRADLAVRAFNELGLPLVVVGGGEDLEALRRIARPNVRLLGYQTNEAVRDLMHRSKALIFPSEEDFGIVPVEAMAAGRPVIAYNRGGARETVLDGVTGVLFDRQDVESLVAAVRRLEQIEGSLDPAALVAHARRFDRDAFVRGFTAAVQQAMDRKGSVQ